ncbi:MAG: hypothetical protein COA57_10915 [Flavobacteriales bacterium]|nr:metal-dependent hydrolase [Bacteroidales bacterium AH-315-I05]PCJ83621.1 MAG: hypothetical protein COA57_10915 [Flavobacteriales bacterium]
MASIFSHAIVALATGKVIKPKANMKFFACCILCAVFPDADVVAFKVGIPYEHVFGHRGFSHSVLFAALLGLIMSLLFCKNSSTQFLLYWFVLFLCTISHAILDAMTNGGLGVAFFAPFDNARYFFGFRPIQVSPIGIASFFSERGWRVIKSELLWIWAPAIVVIILSSIFSRRNKG